MDSKYKPSEHEDNIYQMWEKKGLFNAVVDDKKDPFCIILPPPNANANLHLGHAMYVYEDVMIRYNKLLGKNVFWLPGADHAGIETQFLYEKQLKKEGKSRFDFDRETLFKDILTFVMKNRNTMENQLRRLGFALDWSKKQFTMDENIVKVVYQTFFDLHKDGLIYRANRLVNYCTSCGTSFSDLEVVYVERTDPLYYMKYGPFTLATVRPETKFGDTAIAVHPDDKRYTKWIGQEIEVDGLIGSFKVKVVADRAVDPRFGTGAVKVTPAHDFNDYEIAKRHNLPMKQVIGFDGKLNEHTGKYQGLRIFSARKLVVEDLKAKGYILKIKEDYVHRVATCYRCGKILEPLPKEQWFINVKPLRERAIKLVKDGSIKIHPSRFKKEIIRILENFIDWNVSRQIVWGIRIPAYRCMGKLKVKSFKLKDQGNWFVSIEKPEKCQICGECEFVQDEDTFDTWFSSGQWPFATLQALGQKYSDYFYPTTVMETGYDILRAWVSRMIMIGFYQTKKIPFENVFLHGMVRDKKGQKMSKSKGNVINPLEMIEKYGADALRVSLIFGTQEGGDVVLSEEKIMAMRNFANKIWNIGRFVSLSKNQLPNDQTVKQNPNPNSQTKEMITKFNQEFSTVEKKYHNHFKKFEFAKAFDLMYDFVWHRLADIYIEQLKDSIRNDNIESCLAIEDVYLKSLQMLHPYMPFVTEAIWTNYKGNDNSILQTQFKI